RVSFVPFCKRIEYSPLNNGCNSAIRQSGKSVCPWASTSAPQSDSLGFERRRDRLKLRGTTPLQIIAHTRQLGDDLVLYLLAVANLEHRVAAEIERSLFRWCVVSCHNHGHHASALMNTSQFVHHIRVKRGDVEEDRMRVREPGEKRFGDVTGETIA